MTNAAFWDNIAEKYAKDAIEDMPAYLRTRDRMRAILQPHHSVLELGCGTGSTAYELADCVAQYLGTDLSPQMIAIANRKRTDQSPDALRFEVAEAEHLPKGAFDVVLALNLLHLLKDIDAVLARIFAALPTGGLLIAKTGLIKDGSWVLRLLIPAMRAVGKAPFVATLSQSDLTDALTRAGFVIDESVLQSGMAPRLFTVARKP